MRYALAVAMLVLLGSDALAAKAKGCRGETPFLLQPDQKIEVFCYSETEIYEFKKEGGGVLEIYENNSNDKTHRWTSKRYFISN